MVKNEGGYGGGDLFLFEDFFLGRDLLCCYDILVGVEVGVYFIVVGEGMWCLVVEKKLIDIKRFF